MIQKRTKTRFFLAVIPLAIIIGFIIWFLNTIFESDAPELSTSPLPEYISGQNEFNVNISDHKMGLKALVISLNQGGRVIPVFERTFPFKGLFNDEGIRKFETTFNINPSKMNLAQGRIDLQIRVWDYSRKNGGDGNQARIQHKIIIDTIPPAIRALSKAHYINQGGTGFVVYQTSSDSVESGIYVNETFFPGYPFDTLTTEKISTTGFHVCYFTVGITLVENLDLYLWAKDKAGNFSRSDINYRILKKNYRNQNITITDRFIQEMMAKFPSIIDTKASLVDNFLKINNVLREKNRLSFFNMRTDTSPEQQWDGAWIRLKNSANMARFGDKRFYYYMNTKIDEQIHAGVDLASLTNASVQAANNGTVIFAGDMGIYGLTVVLDHGQNLASIYSHLNEIKVHKGQKVLKQESIGITGMTGLALGDHLHFGVLVGGIFVNPIEWWDPHWISDNIEKKLALLKDKKNVESY